MPRRPPSHRFLAAAVILGTLALAVPAPAVSATKTYSAANVRGNVAIFRLAGLDPAAVESARLQSGRSAAQLKRATVRRAARRGTLRVRLSQVRWTGSRPRTHTRRTGKRQHGNRVSGHPDRRDKRARPAGARTKRLKLTVVTTDPPSVSITSAPASPTGSTDASIAFSTSRARTTQCQLDLGAWNACGSPVAYGGLASGDHSFTVRVTNVAGSASDSASWTVLAATSTDASITAPPGVGTLLWADEFNGTTLDTSRWRPNWLAGSDTAVTKPVNSSEKSCYDPAQVSVSGGSLRLTAVARNCTANNGVTYPYASGLVQSNSDFRFTYGYAEARMFLEANTDPALGAVGGCGPNWPAFWSNGQSWPADGEIDTMECLGDDVCWHYHYSAGGPGGCPSAWRARMPAGAAGWHTFGSYTRPGSIDFYYDGQLVGTQTDGVVSSKHYLIANLGISGTASKVPQTLLLDHVRVWG